ncbi:MAG: nucleotidyltransferase family protein [Cylindrospermopsis raciborskii]|uniref:nucleotidyltransferase family protein n=1 Tax=Cylindrospermopsis raciborskii TaxID=77022 RepID=UPI003D0CABD3
MRAILLAAGYGTRLRPLTNTIPKCLVPIKGTPLLGIWLERLTRAGIGPFLVNTHYLAEQVQGFVSNSPYRDQVKLVHEPTLLGTAGTLTANLDFFQSQDGMLIHADNYCLDHLHNLIEAHRKRPTECVMTMMTFRTDQPSNCGIVDIDENRVVTGFYEKVSSPPGNLANGAVYILSAAMLRELSLEFSTVKDFSNEVLPHFIGRIFTYETLDVFIDIGTPEAYKRVNQKI